MKKKERVLREKCPLCGVYDHVGSYGHSRFFCCECCVEFKVVGSKTTVYALGEDGSAEIIKVIKREVAM